MEMLMEIRVKISDPVSVEGHTKTIVMIPFTAEATGKYFQGKTIGSCVDTQKIDPGKPGVLSARYMLEGRDFQGDECRVFVENNGSDWSHMNPMLITDSEALKEWETMEIYGTVEAIEGGVLIRFYKA